MNVIMHVDDLIDALKKYREKYENDEVNIQVYAEGHMPYDGLTVYNVDFEDGYCEIYCEDSHGYYGDIFKHE